MGRPRNVLNTGLNKLKQRWMHDLEDSSVFCTNCRTYTHDRKNVHLKICSGWNQNFYTSKRPVQYCFMQNSRLALFVIWQGSSSTAWWRNCFRWHWKFNLSQSQLLYLDATKAQQLYHSQTPSLKKILPILPVDRLLACQTVLAGSLGGFLIFDPSIFSGPLHLCPPEFGPLLATRLGNSLYCLSLTPVWVLDQTGRELTC